MAGIRTQWVAVVVRKDGAAHRADESFTAWVGEDKEAVITKAVNKTAEWGFSVYTVKIGKLTQTADLAYTLHDEQIFEVKTTRKKHRKVRKARR